MNKQTNFAQKAEDLLWTNTLKNAPMNQLKAETYVWLSGKLAYPFHGMLLGFDASVSISED